MSSFYGYIGVWLVGLIFGAGIAWGVFLRLQRDVNGLGRCVRRDRWNKMLADMVALEKRQDREQLAEMMKEN